jgi:predicted MPP superfamily phosphohydrolase
MEPDKEQEKIIKSGLYSSKQLFIATIIGGTTIAGFILGCNLWSVKKKLPAIIPVVIGLISEIVLMLPGYFTIRHIQSNALRNILAITLLVLLQTIFTIIFRIYIKKNKRFGAFILPEIDEKIYHQRKLFPVIIISIIYFFSNFAFFYRSWIILGIYLFPHFYSYILVHKTFGTNKIAKHFFTSIVFLACLFPLVQTADEYLFAFVHRGFLRYNYLNVIVGYYAVFVLYMFLFILGFNVILLLTQIIRFVPPMILKNKTVIFVTILITMLLGITILAIGTYINNDPVINRYSITLPKNSSTLNSLKVISVSDLHLKNITSINFLKTLVNKIRETNPDIIVLPGDIAETYGNTTKEKLNEFLEILKDIKSEYGIYAIRGNHDYPGDMADKIDFYKRLGITMLADSLIELDNKICIIGLNYRGNNEKRPIDSLLRFKTKDLPILLLDHAPYCLEEAYKNKIDVQFSGHTHYGQIWPLNYITEAMYDIAWGYKKIDDTYIFVSCGVQDAILPGRQDLSIPVRIGSVSEIMEINIKFRED